MEEKVLEACLLAGRILMTNQAEMYRVEDTLMRIGRHSGFEVVCYTTQTGIFVGIDGKSNVRMTQITNRSINLDKITKINQLSREFVNNQRTLDELIECLKELEREQLFFPKWLEILSAAMISGSMMILFGGQLKGMPLTFLIGGVGYIVYLQMMKPLQVRFLGEFLVSFLVGVVVLFLSKQGIVQQTDVVLIGCVMPFVPGVAITNSVRDLLAGHLLSGVSRMSEATMTACAIGFGIAFAFQVV
ncbi:Uncharacterized membrane protein YjjP, DUF1212 family [Pilibacter termitis]|uniref:Uncharacterized membrane protein YjjP, DUF1212 family n=1 Tax=Pilibacter termitis TaxID=263852 RepID=A0A1T4PMA8_9ENTE|nr:threonine/serine exporter family protein [Pilibacter termitis]SJZ92695.1 Uncharacterized membrane protein YjjP, DUF1212 family [Pilibacter termitis]